MWFHIKRVETCLNPKSLPLPLLLRPSDRAATARSAHASTCAGPRRRLGAVAAAAPHARGRASNAPRGGAGGPGHRSCAPACAWVLRPPAARCLMRGPRLPPRRGCQQAQQDARVLVRAWRQPLPCTAWLLMRLVASSAVSGVALPPLVRHRGPSRRRRLRSSRARLRRGGPAVVLSSLCTHSYR